MRYAGNYGYGWPSFAASKIWDNAGFGARYLVLVADEVYPSRGPGNRWSDYPLRYLTQVG